MRNFKFINLQLLLVVSCLFQLQAIDKGVIRYPIAEMNNSYPPTPKDSAISPGVTNKNCQRAHQALFNEVVEILDEKDDALQISLRNVTYKSNDSISSFWTHKENITRLEAIENIDVRRTIPHEEYAAKPTIVLTYPWKGFSVGTRFIRLASGDDCQNCYTIARADFDDQSVIIDEVPCDCAQEERVQDPLSSRKLFIKNIKNLLTKVAQDQPGDVIGYVWGGSSFINGYQRDSFYEKDGLWQRHGKKYFYTGYDCSELVMRMAQIAGIKFPWKTTVAIRNNLQPLTQDDLLQQGDLIWIQGHVMIVSSIENNELIEARGYASGFGCVNKIKLCDMFEGIVTYDDLLADYYAHKPLLLKDAQGLFYKKFDTFALLKLIA